MGLVGIWCMHFIGNRAIILDTGNDANQLVYNAGFTTLSVFLPIIGLTVAFSAAEYRSSSKALQWISLICTGVFAGLSVVGMHYLGNFGITNYWLRYKPRFLAASIIIAIGDCMTVLILFYRLREKWISAWWKRLCCAFLLAGGVSAMHFTASTDCVYIYRGHPNSPTALQSRNTQVGVAGAFVVIALLGIIGLVFFTRHRTHVLKNSSQKVMLACAMFGPDDRILVTTEGVLPAREITDKYQHRTFNEDFDTGHPVFQWIFRVTHNWSGVSELIPRMKSHLAGLKIPTHDDSKPESSKSSVNYDPDTYNDYSLIFRERFCTAAASLASSMHLPVERIGVLYDKIVETGTLTNEDWAKRTTVQLDKIGEMESGDSLHLFGKGQLLFITRQLSTEDADKLLNAGYKFGSIQQVGRNIAEAMQIPTAALEGHVGCLKRYVKKRDMLEKAGTWLSFFGLIPRPSNKGFDVGVKKADQDQLPDVQLLPGEPQQWQIEFLERMDGMNTGTCLAFLEDRNSIDYQRPQEERQFAMMMQQAVVILAKQVPTEWFRDARFLARPVFAHYTSQHHNRGVVTWIYSFCLIADMHTTLEACDSLARVPLTFFSARQRCYKGSPDHGILGRDIHQEFGPLFARRITRNHARSHVRKVSRHITRSNFGFSKPSLPPIPASRRSMSFSQSEGSSVHELVEKPNKSSDRAVTASVTGSDRETDWGGILVNSETVIKSDSKSDCSHESRQFGLGMKVAVGTSKQEDTFVDVLMEVTRIRFMSPKVGY